MYLIEEKNIIPISFSIYNYYCLSEMLSLVHYHSVILERKKSQYLLTQ